MNDVKKDTDVALKHIPLGKWFLLTGIVFCVIALFVWIFFGKITSTLSLNGVVAIDKLPEDVYMGEAGYVIRQNYWPGDRINKGAPIYDYIPETVLNSEQDGVISPESMKHLEKEVLAPYDGYVVNTYLTKGDKCSLMQPAASVAPADKSRKIVAMVRDYELNILKLGMNVRVKLEAYPNDEDGYITGKITYIGDSFIPKEQLKEYLGTDQIVNAVMEDSQENFMVIITVDSDEKGNPIWYDRTNKENNTDVRYGMVCNIEVATMTYNPSMFLFRQ